MTALQQSRERAMALGLMTGLPMVLALLAMGLWSASLTLLADGLRAALLLSLDVFVLVMLRRIHRGRMPGYHYGVGKLEHFLNLLVSAGLVLAAVAVLGLAGLRAVGAPGAASGLGLGLATAVSAVNTAQNIWCLSVLWRAGRDGTSVLINGQIRSRLTKLVSSSVSTTALLVATIFAGQAIGRLADLGGAVLVAGVMLWTVARLAGAALPDLLDTMLDEPRQVAINAVLIRHFHDYALLHHVRTRQSGNAVFIEIGLAHDAGRRIGEADRANQAIMRDLEALIPGAQVSIVTSAFDPAEPGVAAMAPRHRHSDAA